MMRSIAFALVVLLPLVAGQAANGACDTASTCDACTQLANCGFCADVPFGASASDRVSVCLPGSAAGPDGFQRSFCLSGWSWVRSQCAATGPTTPSGTGDMVGTGTGDVKPPSCESASTCGTCASMLGCGFCRGVDFGGVAVDTCQPGTAAGPAGFAASSCTGGWAYTTGMCSGTGPTTPVPGTVVAPVNCQDLTTCSACSMAPGCGYCGQVAFGPSLVNVCLSGTAAGPTGFAASQCTSGWAYVRSSCPAGEPTTPGTGSTGMTGMTGMTGPGTPESCSALNCGDCTRSRGCGWCPGVLYGNQLVSTCVPGTATAPVGFDASACQLGYIYRPSQCSA